MDVARAMSATVLTLGPDHTLREAARLMAAHNVGAAVVLDIDGEGPGIVTERDVLRSIAAGEDPDTERVAAHLTVDATVAQPQSSLEHAAEAMLRGGFRHLVVVGEDGQLAGVVSMRDIVRCWVQEGLVR
jgi:CBS domain-containing protein